MISQKKAGVILSYCNQALGTLCTLLYTPFMLRTLGQSEYGLYSLVTSTTSMLMLLNLGFSGCYLYFYNKIKAEKDEQEVARFNATFLCIFLVIAGLCLIGGILMLCNMELVFGSKLSAAEMGKARILMILMIANITVSFPCNVFSSGIESQERFVFVNLYSLAATLLCLGANIAVLLLGMGSVGLVGIALGASILKLFIYGGYATRKLDMQFCFSGLRFALVRSMFSFTVFVFLNQLTNTLNGQVDKFLLGHFLGTESVAIYAVGSSLNAVYQQFASMVTGVFGPQITRMVAIGKSEGTAERTDAQLTDLFARVSRIQAYILLLIATGFLFCGKYFVQLWAGDGYEESYYIAVGLMFAGSVPYFQSIAETIQRAKNKHQIRAIVFFFAAILNVIVSIPLLLRWGAFGATLGTMLTWVLVSWIFLNVFYHKVLHLDMFAYWKQVAGAFKGMTVAFVLGCGIRYVMDIDGWISLIVFIASYTLVYGLCCWFLSFNKYEKDLGLSMLKSIRKLVRK